MTASIWMESQPIAYSNSLQLNGAADVCVIGAGIAGITTAYCLAREGKSVVVLDDGPIGGGETQRTTAHLANAIDDRYVEIERCHGQEGARLAAESHTAAIDFIEATVAREKIACDFERIDGYLFVPAGEPRDILDEELQAARRAGLVQVQLVPYAPMANFDTGPCLRFPNQGQFHPTKYLNGLAEAILRMGGRIYTGAHVVDIEAGPPALAKTKNGPAITASAVVVATNTPINDRVAIHTKQAAYISYVLAFAIPKGSVTKALYWDTADPYHYVRVHSMPNDDLLIVGGEDHKTGQAQDADVRYSRLDMWARERFPIEGRVRHRWSGQVLEPVDGLAFIGRNPLDAENVYVATGDSGMGMTHGTIAGMLLTDLILGRRNPWASLYDPSRKSLRAAGTFLQENLNVARQYGSWLTSGDVSSTDQVARGAGAILRRGLTKVAVYRDQAGQLHELSAVCPHLGCIVEWNSNENSWDCPCHGSRFDCNGKVMNGPANSDLPAIREG